MIFKNLLSKNHNLILQIYKNYTYTKYALKKSFNYEKYKMTFCESFLSNREDE